MMPSQPPQQPQPDNSAQPMQSAMHVDAHILNVLRTRMESLDAQDAAIMPQIFNPQTMPFFMKLLPELVILLKKISEQGDDGADQGQDQDAPSAPQQNPLTNDNVSPGLTGGAGG